ncbi:hypothetical protein FACS1894189_0080 [Planctomycetales bacterium]|nr:hypothetical protein FACS1894189_0080 [Planctomycetales bacterium]
MKANFKTLCVVSFLFLAAGISVAVFCTGEQKMPVKAESVTVLSPEEMMSIVGGAEGEGCTNIPRVCSGSGTISCGCQSHIDIGDAPDTTTYSIKEYAGEDFNSPNSSPGSNTKSQLVQVEQKECYKLLSCMCVDYRDESQCNFGGGGCGNANIPYSICVDWNLVIGNWVKFKKGMCVDP